MTRIKIESNPYEQNISFSKFDFDGESFQPITDSSSKLLSVDFTKCFFPFKAKEILSQLVDEYAVNGNLEIVFDGSSDEYEELEEVHKLDIKFENVKISKGEKYLECGRDVINRINEIFKCVEPIVKDSVSNNESINKNLQKYSDVANDFIPICVIGNTNMGKSTFINALLGAEYLPKDRKRCTAKIYKITQSKQDDRANVEFLFAEKTVFVNFKSNIDVNGEVPNDFHEELNRILFADEVDTLAKRISNLLKFLNLYNDAHQSHSVSDLIKLEVPFNSDVFQKSKNPFVIFDTPGSNYAGNIDDAELLKQQMQDLTNGLPVFVTDNSNMSSNDNESLIKKLQSFDELDQRFTILVINKADDRELNLNERTNIQELTTETLGQFTTKKLSEKGLQGIYFVSSFFGLGFKNNGKFLDVEDSYTYEDDVRCYDESFPRGIKKLYKFNIIPAQIKNKFEQEISDSINPVYLNSGLYSIENEIETYANKYSAYNKCQQSHVFLEKVVGETLSEIEKQKEKIRIQKESLNSFFDTEKRELIQKLEGTAEDKKKEFNATRDSKIKEELEKPSEFFQKEELKDIDEKNFVQQKEEFSISKLNTSYEDAKKAVFDNLGKDVSAVGSNIIADLKDKKFVNAGKNLATNLGKAFSDLGTNVKNAISERSVLTENIKEAESEAYEKSLEIFKAKYDEISNAKQEEIYNESKNYWIANSEELKNELIAIVSMSKALADDQKALVKEIIARYEKMTLEKQLSETSEKVKYKALFSNRIDISSLWKDFNKQMSFSVEQLYKGTQEKHKEAFEKWSDELLNVIILNVGGMNPKLKFYQDTINDLSERNRQLERNCLELKNYAKEIENLISWKEA